MSTRAQRSLERRLRFAGSSRLFFDRIAAGACELGPRRSRGALRVHRILDRMAVAGFDLAESLRLGRAVPRFGEARQALFGSEAPLSQHPRYYNHWYDASRHALVGMHLGGADLIEHAGKLHFLELNLDAAMRPERRRLYDEDLDPIVSGIAQAAKSWGFRRLVPYHSGWDDRQIAEFARAAERFGLEIVPCAIPYARPRALHPLVVLPRPLAEGTMYVVYSSRHTPIDWFVCDKIAAARWLAEELARSPAEDGNLAQVPTRERVFVPPLHESPRWPNLVFKLADWEQATFVGMARVRDEREALAALGLRDPAGIPGALRVGFRDGLVNLVSRRGRPLYQPFVPPPLLDDGRAVKHRAHLLVTPLGARFLSAHAAVGAAPVPEELAFGVVQDPAPYLLSFSGAGAHYRRLERSSEEAVRRAVDELGAHLTRALSSRFQTSAGAASALGRI